MRHYAPRPWIGHDFMRGFTFALPINAVMWVILVSLILKLR